MSILLSGDFHANSVNELSSITKQALLKKYKQERFYDIQYHIILGDGGFLWPGNLKTDLFNYEVLANRPFPILCVIGNHEPMLGMDNLPETDIGIGETVYQIQDKPFIAYLKRGKIYTIDGLTFLVLGGALSIDKAYRKPGVSWWEREYWTAEEKKAVMKLIKTNNVFDCVLSHTGPHYMNYMLFDHLLSEYTKKFHDEVAFLNEEIEKKIQFKEWWAGHWHQDLYHYHAETGRGYQYLYKMTKIIDHVDNNMVVYNEGNASER